MSSNSSEAFRSQMVSRLYDTIPQDQLQSVLAVLDSAMQDYDITRKPVTLVPASGLRGGMPLDKLQALMGHTKPETTLIYAKQDQTDLQREHNRVYA